MLQLGVTTIGDLLLRNRITDVGEDAPLINLTLKIPNYQRPYKWTAKNAMQLLDDIIEAKNENKERYRVGTLILHHDGRMYNIVDGQQRVTTFVLLLKALLEDGKISLLEETFPYNSKSLSNVRNNYQAFVRRRESMLDDRTRELYAKDKKEEYKRDDRSISDLRTYIENNCELIVVITEDLSEAFQFFDSQNARGKKLYPHDLLKAYHLRELGDAAEKETERVVERWEGMEQNVLADFFGEYLYRVSEWVRGNRSYSLDEQNIYKFKGITKRDNSPYAQYSKGAYAYANMLNHSTFPFVTGQNSLNLFQLDSPIVAGKPFFEYTFHYFR